MVEIINNITLDVAIKSDRAIILGAKQGDRVSRYILATILDGGSPYPVQKTSGQFLNILRPDLARQSFETGVVQGDSSVLFEIPAWGLEIPGRARLDITLQEEVDSKTTNEDGTPTKKVIKLTTQSFYIEIFKTAADDYNKNLGG